MAFPSVASLDDFTGASGALSGAGAPAFGSVASVETPSTPNQAYLTVPVPSGATTNDILLCFMGVNDAGQSVTTPPSGWTLVSPCTAAGVAPSDTDVRGWLYWRRAGGSEPADYTWTFSGNVRGGGVMLRYTGCATTGDPWDDADIAGESATATAKTFPDATTSGSNRRIVNFLTQDLSADGSPYFSAWGNSANERLDRNCDPIEFVSLGAADYVRQGAGSGSQTVTAGLSDMATMATVALRGVDTNWSDGMFDSGMTYPGLQKTTFGGQSYAYQNDVSNTWAGSYWNQATYQDVEVYAIVNDAPVSTTGMALWWRVRDEARTGPPGALTNCSGYSLTILGGTIDLECLDANGSGQVAIDSTTYTPADGDVLIVRHIGTRIRVWKKVGSTVTLLFDAVDRHLTGPGYVGLAIDEPSSTDGTWREIGAAEVTTYTDPYANRVLRDHPVAYWRLDSAARTADETPYGLTLTEVGTNFTNAVAVPRGVVGLDGAVALNNQASSGYLSLANANLGPIAGFTGVNPFSFEAWTRDLFTDTAYRRVFSFSDESDASTNGFHLDYQNGAGFVAVRRQGGTDRSRDGLPAGWNTASGETNAGPWHTVGVYNGSTLELYVNGVSFGTIADANSISSYAGDFRIGTGQFGASSLRGTVDEVAIYDYALSREQVLAHFHAGMRRGAYWSKQMELKPHLVWGPVQPAGGGLEPDLANEYHGRIGALTSGVAVVDPRSPYAGIGLGEQVVNPFLDQGTTNFSGFGGASLSTVGSRQGSGDEWRYSTVNVDTPGTVADEGIQYVGPGGNGAVVIPGREYVLAGEVWTAGGTLRLRARYLNAALSELVTQDVTTTCTAGAWQRLNPNISRAPRDAAYLQLLVLNNTAFNWSWDIAWASITCRDVPRGVAPSGDTPPSTPVWSRKGTPAGGIAGCPTCIRHASDATNGWEGVFGPPGSSIHSYQAPVGRRRTVVFWCWPTDSGGVWVSFGQNAHVCLYDSTGFGWNTGNSDGYGLSSAAWNALKGKWNHLAIVAHSGDYTQTKIYVDGTLQTGLTQWAGTPPAASAQQLYSGILWGHDRYTRDEYNAPGYMSDLAVYDRELTAAEILALYQAADGAPTVDYAGAGAINQGIA